MRRLVILALLIILTASFLLWGGSKRSWAAKEERIWFSKVLAKLEIVLDNQRIILKELRAPKKEEE